MKKNQFISVGVAILAITSVTTFNASLNLHSEGISYISLTNVEALAKEQEGGDVTNCPIIQYTRNTKEQYVVVAVQYSVNGGFYTSHQGRTITWGVQAFTGGTVGIPDCVDSPGNCREKSFIENASKYY
jgi:hypothetical protein